MYSSRVRGLILSARGATDERASLIVCRGRFVAGSERRFAKDGARSVTFFEEDGEEVEASVSSRALRFWLNIGASPFPESFLTKEHSIWFDRA